MTTGKTHDNGDASPALTVSRMGESTRASIRGASELSWEVSAAWVDGDERLEARELTSTEGLELARAFVEPTTGAFSLLDGTLFDPYAEPVQTAGITLASLALGLSRTFRFRGQTRRAISVDEHLVRQTRMTALLLDWLAGGGPVGESYRRWSRALLLAIVDDAHEALTPGV